MRQALNNNPLMQIGLLAVLAIVVVFLFMTRLKGDEPPATEERTPTASDVASTPAPVAPAADAGAAPAVPPADAAAPPAVAEPPAGSFEAGPGLPAKIVDAHDDGDTVVLLISRKEGIDDEVMRKTVKRFKDDGNVAFFDALALDIGKYSRVAQGVDVNRVPALIVLSPRRLSGPVPTASISYGFRGPKSVEQAIADAGYDGKSVPYFPE